MTTQWKWALFAGLAALTASAAYLMIARGPAILLDLSSGIAGCF